MKPKTRKYLAEAREKVRHASAPEWPECDASGAKAYVLSGAFDGAKALAYEIFGEPFETGEVKQAGIRARLMSVPVLDSSLERADLTPETVAKMALCLIPEEQHPWYALTRQECLRRSSAFVHWVSEFATRPQVQVA